MLLDTSFYITALRRGDQSVMALRRLDSGSVLWLSAVVLEELYAGATGRATSAVERLQRDFEGARRILVPNLNDWAEAGEVLARLAAKYDHEQIGRARLTNDALLATSAGRAGICIISSNKRDFQMLSEFRAFRWQVSPL